VRLRSPDPFDKPRVLFNYLSHEEDWIEMRACVRWTREIFAQAPFDEYRGDELQPGSSVQSDDAIDAFIKRKVESAYHPCGTCKMERADDHMAVTDAETKVIGVDGLHIVDTSIMPRVTTGNLNAPAIMIGEKASDIILGLKPLPASNAPYFKPDNWQTAQR